MITVAEAAEKQQRWEGSEKDVQTSTGNFTGVKSVLIKEQLEPNVR
jgi:hypothetical protein